MNYYVRKNVPAGGDGSDKKPFSTIGEAAVAARPGDTVLIGDGVWREWVSPARGGTDDAHRIVYRAAEGAHPVISGAEILEGWEAVGDDLYRAEIPRSVFGGFCPYDVLLAGDWYDNMGQDHHVGEVYADGEALYEAASLDRIAEEDRGAGSWFSEAGEESITFWVRMPGKSPADCQMEVSARPFGFFPEKEHLDFITVSGLTVECVATQWAPPTAFQPGAVGTHWSRGWIIENCTVRNSKCVGISVGKRREDTDNRWTRDPRKGGAQTYSEVIFSNLFRDWNKNSVGSHLVRNNHIYNCGQAGIVGCMGGAFSRFEGNHIHHVAVRGEFSGAEIAGIKLHAAIDAVLRRNVIHDAAMGIWLDWEAQGARVTQNVFRRNLLQDLLVEVCHGPVLADHNLFLSSTAFLDVSQGTALAHNLFLGKIIAFPDSNRFTMYHIPHETAVLGSIVVHGGDNRYYNNLFVGKSAGTSPYNEYNAEDFRLDTSHNDKQLGNAGVTLASFMRGNAYGEGAAAWVHEKDPYICEAGEISCEYDPEDDTLRLELSERFLDAGSSLVDSDLLGHSFESGGRYENPDGSDYILEEDFFGRVREGKYLPGPFKIYVGNRCVQVDLNSPWKDS